jgi:hypothetical protein
MSEFKETKGIKQYISKNLQPLLIGFISAMLFIYLTNTIADIIIKLALIKK